MSIHVRKIMRSMHSLFNLKTLNHRLDHPQPIQVLIDFTPQDVLFYAEEAPYILALRYIYNPVNTSVVASFKKTKHLIDHVVRCYLQHELQVTTPLAEVRGKALNACLQQELVRVTAHAA